MATKYKGKYRSESARWQNWDYSNPGAYFITICTKNRVHYFGHIINGEMKLNTMGRIAWDCWMQLPSHFTGMELGEFVVMPDHVHGIIIINERNGSDRNGNAAAAVGTGHAPSLPQTSLPQTSLPQTSLPQTSLPQTSLPQTSLPQTSLPQTSLPQTSLPQPLTPGQRRQGNPGKNSIPTMVGSYKSAVARLIHLSEKKFTWQTRYYDHVIRTSAALDRISIYIKNNPANWNSPKMLKNER